MGDEEREEPDATGRVLLRPNVPFRSRREALEQMVRVVEGAPSVQRPREEILWQAEPPGEDVWQAPEETERLGTGDCEDLEMYAARQDLDHGVPDVELCMTVSGHRNEHVFGLRSGQVVDQSEEAGMSPLPPGRHEARVCVPVPSKGTTTMDSTFGAFVHQIGVTHGDAVQAWQRAAAMAAQQFPRARPLYQAVMPGLEATSRWFSRIHLNAWDQIGNAAREQKVTDSIWLQQKAEERARAAYLSQALPNSQGDDADFVLSFERQFGRPPPDRASVRAAIQAMLYIATAREHPGYKARLAQIASTEPTRLSTAAVQVAYYAQGLLGHDAFPVRPHCPTCIDRRSAGLRRVLEPEEISLSTVYNVSNTITTATGPGAVAVANSGAQGSASMAPPPAFGVPGPVLLAEPVLQGAPPAPGMPFGAPVMVSPGMPAVAPVAVAPVYPMAEAMPPAGGGLPGILGLPLGGGPTSISDSGNVTIIEQQGASSDDGGDGNYGSDAGDTSSYSTSDDGSIADAMGLSTGGPAYGDDSPYLTFGGEEDEFTTGGVDDDGELMTGGDDQYVEFAEDEVPPEYVLGNLFDTGGNDDVGSLYDDGEGNDAESYLPLPSDCESGTCGLF